MAQWKPEQDDGDVDLTPMIDIVFLLIVFFMTVASVITAEKVPVDMAVALNSTIPEDYGERTTITVQQDGSIFAGVFPVSLDELTDILREEIKADPSVKVYLRADRATEHQFVNDVMEACRSVGLFNIIFAAYQSEK